MELDELPDGLAEMPSVQRVKHWYAESFLELREFPLLELPRALKEKYRASGAYYQHYRNGGNGHNMVQGTAGGEPPSRHYYAPFDPQDMALLPQEATRYNADFVKIIETIKRRHDPVVTTVGKYSL